MGLISLFKLWAWVRREPSKLKTLARRVYENVTKLGECYELVTMSKMCCVVSWVSCRVSFRPTKGVGKTKGKIMTLNEAKEAITNYQPFNAGNLSGAYERYDAWSSGYVVRSYGVLIAESFGRVSALATDAYNYSQTTSKHANIVKRAWGLN
jgi:hypothetical protein